MNYRVIAEWSQVISTPLFLIVLAFVWVRYIQPAVLAAQAAQNARIAEAERHRDQARAALDSLQGEIGRAEADAQAIQERAASQALAEETALVDEAREAGDRTIRNAHGELGRARETARGVFRDELLNHSLERAKDEAARRIDTAVDERLVSSFVNSFDGASD